MRTQLYTICIVLTSCIVIPQMANAQCTCANGDTPDSLIHNFTLAPTSNFNSTITFPQFDPSVGTLACVNLSATVSAVANLSIRNLDSVQRDYQFLYTQAISFTGPGGLSSFANTGLFYGPTTLDPFGTGIDSVRYGPDTPFRDYGLSRTITNVSPYLGSGNVSINYTNTGSTLLLQGSNNYQSTVSTFAWGNFKLTYYWCSSTVLPTGMRGFNAIKKNQIVLLQWQTQNELPNTAYQVQASYDGHNFKSAKGNAKKLPNTADASSYEFEYEAPMNFSGKMFFRIKQLKPSGQIGYSTVRVVDFSNTGEASIVVSPNPVVRHLTIGFKDPQSGQLRVELINALGQAVYSRLHVVSGHNKLQLQLNGEPQPGIHYLRIRNLKTNEQLVQKVMVR